MENDPAPLWTNPYFKDLFLDMLHCWHEHCEDLYAAHPTDSPEVAERLNAHRECMLTKAELLERWLDPVPTERSPRP